MRTRAKVKRADVKLRFSGSFLSLSALSQSYFYTCISVTIEGVVISLFQAD